MPLMLLSSLNSFVPLFCLINLALPSLAAELLPAETRMQTALAQGDYFRVVEWYKDAAIHSEPTPVMRMAVGYAWLKLNHPEAAKTALGLLVPQTTPTLPGIPSLEQMLSQIQAIDQLLPPLYPLQGLPRIQVRTQGETPWENFILQRLPDFPLSAWRVLRKDPPPVQLVLIPDRAGFNALHRLFLEAEPKPNWKDGTGSNHLVLLCGENQNGESSSITPANALHEYGHAILHTAFGDHYSEIIPPWMDEGLAGLMGSDLDPALLSEAQKTVAAAPSPDFFPEALSSGLFYEAQPDWNYRISLLMVAELRRKKGPEVFRKILEQTKKSGNFRQGFQQSTEMAPEELYRLTLQRRSPQ
ncbi:MAG: hypothetical protein HY399_04825 [Elusimicrobia bacterium]|nr:hypothetical protein [Elusimicrobiota bacterium]